MTSSDPCVVSRGYRGGWGRPTLRRGQTRQDENDLTFSEPTAVHMPPRLDRNRIDYKQEVPVLIRAIKKRLSAQATSRFHTVGRRKIIQGPTTGAPTQYTPTPLLRRLEVELVNAPREKHLRKKDCPHSSWYVVGTPVLLYYRTV